MNRRSETLFSMRSLSEYMELHLGQMIAEIDAYDADRLLNTNHADLADYFVRKHGTEPLRLLTDQIQVGQAEQRIDISQERTRDIPDRSRPFYVTGTVYSMYIPYEGDDELFKCRPSEYKTVLPLGVLASSTLELTATRTDHESASVREELDGQLNQVSWYVDRIAANLAPFCGRLKQEAESRIAQRRQKLLNDRSLVASLGYPLRARSDAPTTYIAPEVRRKAILAPPLASAAPFIPEPALDMAQYEAILEIIQSTATMLERNPTTFQQLNEQDLRNLFLLPLNSHFEGQVTGETFNVGGKTDILVRSGDKTIFIAECKIWRGPKSLTGAVDQLLGYMSWRDTKTAILLFNRDKELSKVLEQLPLILQQHQQFKRMHPYADEAGCRCVIANRDDPNREIMLTVLAFDVPA